jgi:hypothetical protein
MDPANVISYSAAPEARLADRRCQITCARSSWNEASTALWTKLQFTEYSCLVAMDWGTLQRVVPRIL